MEQKDVYTDYQSPPGKRLLARGLLWVGVLITVLALWAMISDYQKRKEAGRPGIPAASVVTLVAPLGMVLLGLWIGHGQTRINLRRGTIENRPLGLPFLARVSSLEKAKRLYVGYYRAPSGVYTSHSIPVTRPPGAPLWFVRIEGEKFKIMLIRQRTYEEAEDFALRLSDRTGIPIEAQDRPEDG